MPSESISNNPSRNVSVLQLGRRIEKMTYTHVIRARVTEEDYRAFEAIAKDEGVKVSDLLRQVVRETNVQSPVGEWE